MFGQKTRPIADFLPRILSHIDGVDTDMVSTYTGISYGQTNQHHPAQSTHHVQP